MSRAVTIACVLRSGGHYTAAWAGALYTSIFRHYFEWPSGRLNMQCMSGGERFVCLSDDPSVPGHVPLAHDWPGWWAKLELLRPGLFDGPVLYLDLDSLVVGDMTPLLKFDGRDGDLALLADFYRPRLRQSGVMLFRPGEVTERLWETFERDAARYIHRYRGDGEWLHAHAPPGPTVQELHPGAVVSLKVHAKKGPPDGASIVAGHGRPKFDQRAAGWAHEAWMGITGALA